MVARARDAGLRCEGVISVSFGCPYEGDVPLERVFGDRAAPGGRRAARRSRSATRPGMANPMQVRGFFERAREELPGVGAHRPLPQHARAGSGERAGRAGVGVESFESSFGELGGCPVPRGATGNIATEDLVSMLHEMGVETGIDLERLLGCARRAQEVLGRPLSGHLLTAGPVDWHRS